MTIKSYSAFISSVSSTTPPPILKILLMSLKISCPCEVQATTLKRKIRNVLKCFRILIHLRTLCDIIISREIKLYLKNSLEARPALRLEESHPHQMDLPISLKLFFSHILVNKQPKIVVVIPCAALIKSEEPRTRVVVT